MGHSWGKRRTLPTPIDARRLANRKRVVRRRRQGRVATVVFFTAAKPGPIVSVRFADDRTTNGCQPDADAVTYDGIGLSSGRRVD